MKNRIPLIILKFSMIAMTIVACSNGNHKSQDRSFADEPNEKMTELEQNLFFVIETDTLNHYWKGSKESISKVRTAVINPEFISIDSSGTGREIIFNIYNTNELMGVVNRVSMDKYGVKSISGLLLEDQGSFVFTVSEDRLIGQIHLTNSDKIVQIRFSDELNEYKLTELNRRDLDVLPGSAPMQRGNN